jgi:hypothetical protein
MVFLRQNIFVSCLALVLLMLTPGVKAQDHCHHDDHACMLHLNLKNVSEIENQIWRDQQYRDIGGLYADFGLFEDAFKVVSLIESGDKRAMTLRRIARAAAYNQSLETGARHDLIARAISHAQDIKDQSAHDIALTYIAAAQSLLLPEGFEQATRTIALIKAQALRDKAFKEVISTIAAHKHIDGADKKDIILSVLDHIQASSQRDSAMQNAAMLMMRDEKSINENAPHILALLSQIQNALIKSKAMNDYLESLRDHQNIKAQSDMP